MRVHIRKEHIVFAWTAYSTLVAGILAAFLADGIGEFIGTVVGGAAGGIVIGFLWLATVPIRNKVGEWYWERRKVLWFPIAGLLILEIAAGVLVETASVFWGILTLLIGLACVMTCVIVRRFLVRLNDR
jgi:hypothetical protein